MKSIGSFTSYSRMLWLPSSFALFDHFFAEQVAQSQRFKALQKWQTASLTDRRGFGIFLAQTEHESEESISTTSPQEHTPSDVSDLSTKQEHPAPEEVQAHESEESTPTASPQEHPPIDLSDLPTTQEHLLADLSDQPTTQEHPTPEEAQAHESEEATATASPQEHTPAHDSNPPVFWEPAAPSWATTGAIYGRPALRPYTPPAPRPPLSYWLKKRPVWITLLCVLLIVGLIILHTVLPASSATLTIVPQTQEMNVAYTFTPGDQTDLATKQFRARMLTYKTPTLSQTTSVSNIGFVPATSAHGQVVFSQIPAEIKVTSGDLFKLANGLHLTIDNSVDLLPGNTYTLPAHIFETGKQGNLPADGIDGYYVPSTLFILCIPAPCGPIAYLSNPQPFTGGTDDYTGPVVSQSDTEPIAAQLFGQTQDKAQQYFRSHLQPGEALLDNLTCTQHETDRPPIGAAGANVTVSMYSDCQIEAYDQQGLTAALQTDAHRLSTFDPHFTLLPPLQVKITYPGTPGSVDIISLIATSKWRLLLDKPGTQAVQQALVGLSQDQARSVLLHRFSCQVSSLSMTWLWGEHMPADPNAIQIIGHYPP